MTTVKITSKGATARCRQRDGNTDTGEHEIAANETVELEVGGGKQAFLDQFDQELEWKVECTGDVGVLLVTEKTVGENDPKNGMVEPGEENKVSNVLLKPTELMIVTSL